MRMAVGSLEFPDQNPEELLFNIAFFPAFAVSRLSNVLLEYEIS